MASQDYSIERSSDFNMEGEDEVKTGKLCIKLTKQAERLEGSSSLNLQNRAIEMRALHREKNSEISKRSYSSIQWLLISMLENYTRIGRAAPLRIWSNGTLYSYKAENRACSYHPDRKPHDA